MPGPLILAVALLFFPSAGATPAQVASPVGSETVPAGAASITGRVIDKDNKRGLAGALVQLTTSDGRGRLMAQTDGDGAYVFEHIAAGFYRLGARHEGYTEDAVAAVIGPEPVANPMIINGLGATAVQLESGGRRTVDFILVRVAAITGRVTRDDGRPLRGAVVSPRMQLSETGFRFSSQWSARTNERGEYVIANLPPGNYQIGATWTDPETEKSTHNLRPRSIYYPGTDNVSEAILVSLSGGRTVTGIDIRFPGSELLRIQGKIVRGSIMAPIEAYLIAGRSLQSIPVARDGSFSTPRLPVGRYTFVVRTKDDDRSEAASLSVDLTAELTDVMLGLLPTGTISGRVVTDEGIPPPDTMQVAAVLSDQGKEIDPFRRDRVDIGSDGKFVVRDLFGERLLQIVGFTDGWTVDQVLVGKTPVTSLTVAAGGAIDDARIVLTRRR